MVNFMGKLILPVDHESAKLLLPSPSVGLAWTGSGSLQGGTVAYDMNLLSQKQFIRKWGSAILLEVPSCFLFGSVGDARIHLYNHVISDFETKINLLKFAHFWRKPDYWWMQLKSDYISSYVFCFIIFYWSTISFITKVLCWNISRWLII
jgi:hypothetical protein